MTEIQEVNALNIKIDEMLSAVGKYPGAKQDREVAKCIVLFSDKGKSKPSDGLIATITGLTLEQVRVSTRRLTAKGIFPIETVYD